MKVFARNPADGFTLTEVLVAVGIVALAFLGSFATVLQAGKMVSAAEEEGMMLAGLEQRIDQLRELEWSDLTNGTGVTTIVWTARPEATTGVTVSQETLTISPYELPSARTLTATWNNNSSPTFSFGAGTQDLSAASAVKAVATVTWTGRRSAKAQTRSLVTVLSRGGISKSDLP